MNCIADLSTKVVLDIMGCLNGLPGDKMAGQRGECLVGQHRSGQVSGHDEEVSPPQHGINYLVLFGDYTI